MRLNGKNSYKSVMYKKETSIGDARPIVIFGTSDFNQFIAGNVPSLDDYLKKNKCFNCQ